MSASTEMMKDSVLKDKKMYETMEKDKSVDMVMLIKINYKSGTSEQFWFKEFDMEYKDGIVTKLKWDALYTAPAPLWFNNAAIESIHVMERALMPKALL